ncbi:MAG: HPF/RaiA family ribosome-associated protein [Gammaproteobacteria bacterium]|nr:HPF/RaiA family ribosome-associated protein [Gammaproteobacteria bacterium]
MTIPLELSFRNFENSEFIEAKVKERCKRMEVLCDEITFCHVVLSAPHQRQAKGKHYEVHIELRLPGTGLAVTKNTGNSEAHDDFYVAIRDAFDALEHQLIQWKDKRCYDVKAHSRPTVLRRSDDR